MSACWSSGKAPITRLSVTERSKPLTQYHSIIDMIGNTPLVRLEQASALTGCEILGKAEFLNPGGSIKDRTALGIIRDAERSGALKPGGTIVEGTAGNTGIGLTS